MSTENDTVVTTETESAEINGTAGVETTTDSDASVETKEEISKAAYEAALAKAEQAEKELQKRDMELNQRRNNEKKAELDRLAAEGKDKERADALQAELDDIRAKQETVDRQNEADKFRKSILEEYPAEVKEAAEDLKLTWDDASSYEEAATQLKIKLEKLSARIGVKKTETDDTEDAPEILANNPTTDTRSETELDKMKKMSAKELRKLLPLAPSR